MKELFAPFGAVSVKRMFGGNAVYADGRCFAIEFDGEIYLKCDDENRAAFTAAGSAPFTYMAMGKRVETRFWRLAEEAHDEPDALKRWASLGLEAARRAASRKARGTPVARGKRREN